MSERYNVFYDFCDECGNEEHDIKFVFEGTWSDLQDHIKLMKKAGCYNIDAVAEPDEEYDEDDGIEFYDEYEDDPEVQYGWYQQDMIDLRYIER